MREGVDQMRTFGRLNFGLMAATMAMATTGLMSIEAPAADLSAGGGAGTAPEALGQPVPGSTAATTPASKTPATGAEASEKRFTQEDIDRAAADARRKGREAAEKSAAKTTEKLLEEANKRFLDELDKRFGNGTKTEGTSGTQSGGSGATGTTATGTNETKTDPKASIPAAGETTTKSDPRTEELERQIKAERAAREKLQAEIALKAKTEAEAKVEAEKAKRRDEVLGKVEDHLKTDGKIPATLAKGLAKVMVADGKIRWDDKRIYFVTDEIDPDDDKQVELPVKDGIAAWGKSAEADQYRPAALPGSGAGGAGAGPFSGGSAPPKFEDTGAGAWRKAEAESIRKFQEQRGGQPR